jgi:hypothetical protein
LFIATRNVRDVIAIGPSPIDDSAAAIEPRSATGSRAHRLVTRQNRDERAGCP